MYVHDVRRTTVTLAAHGRWGLTRSEEDSSKSKDWDYAECGLPVATMARQLLRGSAPLPRLSLLKFASLLASVASVSPPRASCSVPNVRGNKCCLWWPRNKATVHCVLLNWLTFLSFQKLRPGNKEFLLYLQQLVHMGMFNWWGEPPSMRGGSKCASTTAGGQCVITTGVTQKLQWSVSSWGIQLLDVSYVPLLYCLHPGTWLDIALQSCFT